MIDELNMLFNDTNIIPKGATCRSCKYRERWLLNEHSNKIIQCCSLQPSKKSNSGYKTIKVTNLACFRYEDRNKV